MSRLPSVDQYANENSKGFENSNNVISGMTKTKVYDLMSKGPFNTSMHSSMSAEEHDENPLSFNELPELLDPSSIEINLKKSQDKSKIPSPNTKVETQKHRPALILEKLPKNEVLDNASVLSKPSKDDSLSRK